MRHSVDEPASSSRRDVRENDHGPTVQDPVDRRRRNPRDHPGAGADRDREAHRQADFQPVRPHRRHLDRRDHRPRRDGSQDANGRPEYSAKEIAELYSGREEDLLEHDPAPAVVSLGPARREVLGEGGREGVRRVLRRRPAQGRRHERPRHLLRDRAAHTVVLPQQQGQGGGRIRLPDEEGRPRDVRGTTYFEPLRLEGEEGPGQVLGARGRRRLCEQPRDVRARRCAHALWRRRGDRSRSAPASRPRVSRGRTRRTGVSSGGRDRSSMSCSKASATRSGTSWSSWSGHGRKSRAYRFRVPLPQLKTAIDDIDDATDATIEALQGVAENLVREKDRELDEICGQLVADTARRLRSGWTTRSRIRAPASGSCSAERAATCSRSTCSSVPERSCATTSTRRRKRRSRASRHVRARGGRREADHPPR